MSAAKITISLDPDVLQRLDLLVKNRKFPNRSQAVQVALEEKLARLQRTRLAEECAKLDPDEEKAWANLGLSSEVDEWPPY